MKTLFLGLLAVALCSCASQTPQTRIDNNFGLYEKLSEEHKVLVQQGQIAEGMSGSAVFLAWGKPEQKVGGFREGKHFQRWDYTAHRPVVSNNFAFGSSFGRSGRRGGFRGGRFGRGGFGFGQSVTYIPFRSHSVLFVDERVDSWESAQRTPY